MASMISALAFIPRGAAKAQPEQQELSAAEMEALIAKSAGMSLDEVKEGAAENEEEGSDEADMSDSEGEDEEEEAASKDADAGMEGEQKGEQDPEELDKEAQLLKELKMDGYEDEPEGAELMLGGQKLLVHSSNAEDPYVTVPDHEDFDEEDDEDLAVKASDVLLCVARTEEEASTMEVYLYEEEGGKLYVHHDFNLPSFPLALCWMDCDPRSPVAAPADSSSTPAGAAQAAPAHSSFLAVGTFQTGIEIWNLDVLDVLEPVATLGGRDDPDPEVVRRIAEEESKKKGKKGGAKKRLDAALQAKLMGELRPGSHSDAVMCLAWHPAVRARLASGSADHSVKLWDITTQQCTHTFDKLHSNKIQALAFNAAEPNILLSASYDQTACVADVRADLANNAGVMRFHLGADVEQARWSPHHPFLFATALENGNVLFFDARAASSSPNAKPNPLFTVAAHTQACTSLSFNAALPTCFLTAGLDRTVKVWDFNPSPHLVSSKDMKAAGKLFAAQFDSNYPHLLAAGGDKAKLAIWDLREDSKCRAKYGEEVDGKLGKGAAPVNPFAFPTSSQPAPADASSASAAPAPAASADKKKKKKKMKTSTRRVRDDEDE